MTSQYDTWLIPIRQSGTYSKNFDFSRMSAEEWVEYYNSGLPPATRPIRRAIFHARSLDLRGKLAEHGVRVGW